MTGFRQATCWKMLLTVVNTTSLGMVGKSEFRVPLDALSPKATVTDLVYVPLKTRLLTEAAEIGWRDGRRAGDAVASGRTGVRTLVRSQARGRSGDARRGSGGMGRPFLLGLTGSIGMGFDDRSDVHGRGCASVGCRRNGSSALCTGRGGCSGNCGPLSRCGGGWRSRQKSPETLDRRKSFGPEADRSGGASFGQCASGRVHSG